MRYKLGDFVRFVDEKMEGYVTRIIDEQMIGVTGSDDFEIPVLASKVTTVHGREQKNIRKDHIAEEEKLFNGEFKATGVYLAVTSDPKVNSVVHFYLVNGTSFQLLATLTTEQKQLFKGEYSGIIKPGAFEKIYSAQLADLQLWPKFIFRVLFYTSQNIEPRAPLNISEKFKAKDFSGPKKTIQQITPAATGWLIQLDEPLPLIDAQKLKESFLRPAEEKVVIEKPSNETDLHIEKLRNDHHFLSSAEIMAIQIAAFQKTLDSAIVHNLPEIIFIHGSGNGILRHELHKILSKHPKIQTFMDARKEKFGYGATKVLLK
jgi:hypothetical protein